MLCVTPDGSSSRFKRTETVTLAPEDCVYTFFLQFKPTCDNPFDPLLHSWYDPIDSSAKGSGGCCKIVGECFIYIKNHELSIRTLSAASIGILCTMPATADQLICQVSAPWLLLLHTFVFVTSICILAFRTPIRSAPVSQNTQPPYFSSGSTLCMVLRVLHHASFKRTLGTQHPLATCCQGLAGPLLKKRCAAAAPDTHMYPALWGAAGLTCCKLPADMAHRF